MVERLLSEPTALIGAIRLILYAAMMFGLHLTPEQLAAVLLALEAVLVLINRALVTPNNQVALTHKDLEALT